MGARRTPHVRAAARYHRTWGEILDSGVVGVREDVNSEEHGELKRLRRRWGAREASPASVALIGPIAALRKQRFPVKPVVRRHGHTAEPRSADLAT